MVRRSHEAVTVEAQMPSGEFVKVDATRLDEGDVYRLIHHDGSLYQDDSGYTCWRLLSRPKFPSMPINSNEQEKRVYITEALINGVKCDLKIDYIYYTPDPICPEGEVEIEKMTMILPTGFLFGVPEAMWVLFGGEYIHGILRKEAKKAREG